MMDTLSVIKNSGIIAIARGVYGEELIKASLALYEGGVRAFEVTFVHDKPLVQTTEAIVRLTESLPSYAAVGAGTVLEAEQADAAYHAGASFIISPNTDRSVIERTKQLSMISIPGAMTPSEIVSAYKWGADIVKVFPAGILGIEYFKAIKAPLKHIPLAAVAGITPQNIRGFYDAGALAFGISSGLYDRDAINNGDYYRMTEKAQAFYSELRK